MTCTKIPGGFVCGPDAHGKIKLPDKTIHFDFHDYIGPMFYTDIKGTEEYIPANENDPIWEQFHVWLEEYKKFRKEKQKGKK